MNEVVKTARLTKEECALVLGIDLKKPEGANKWKTLQAKAKKYGIGEEYGRGNSKRYSYENVKRLKQLLIAGYTPPVRTELVALVKKQLQDDGY